MVYIKCSDNSIVPTDIGNAIAKRYQNDVLKTFFRESKDSLYKLDTIGKSALTIRAGKIPTNSINLIAAEYHPISLLSPLISESMTTSILK